MFLKCNLWAKIFSKLWKSTTEEPFNDTDLASCITYSQWQKLPPYLFYKKAVLTNFTIFTGKDLCWSLFFKKETPTHVLSCEYYEIFKNTYFEEHLRMAAFRVGFIYVGNLIQIQCPLTDFIRCTAVKNLSKKKKQRKTSSS